MVDTVVPNPGTNDKRDGDANTQRLERDIKETLAKTVEKVWLFGPTLALIVRHVGLAVSLACLLIFLVLPLITPMLSALYVSGLRKAGFPGYGKFVVEAFSEEVIKSRVDQLVADALERENQLVVQNNARLDFVQQLQQTWRTGGSDRSQIYRFPIRSPQDFELEFSATKDAAASPCRASSPDAIAAEEALRSPMFAVSVMGRERFTWTNDDEPDKFVAGENFWNSLTAAEKDALGKGGQGTLALRVLLLPAAKPALKCFTFVSTLIVTLTKSIPAPIRPAAPKPVSAAEKGTEK